MLTKTVKPTEEYYNIQESVAHYIANADAADGKLNARSAARDWHHKYYVLYQYVHVRSSTSRFKHIRPQNNIIQQSLIDRWLAADVLVRVEGSRRLRSLLMKRIRYYVCHRYFCTTYLGVSSYQCSPVATSITDQMLIIISDFSSNGNHATSDWRSVTHNSRPHVICPRSGCDMFGHTH